VAETAHSSLVQKMLDMSPVLAGLDQLDGQKLLKFATKISWKEEERVFYQGEPADSMYVLLGGQVIVWLDAMGKENPIATLKPGSHFGEMAILSGAKRGANVTAVSPSYGISVNIAMLKSNPMIGLNIFKNIARIALERQNMANAKTAEAAKEEEKPKE
jgi:CRP-like cAMP-binding protein